jgi:hypothetical protein
MKPEMSAGAVLEGKPNLTRLKRLANFITEAVTSLPKPSESLEQSGLNKIDTDYLLADRGRTFVNALRESFGDSLQGGLMLRPNQIDGHELIVEANSEDSETTHQTTAEVDILSGEGYVTRLIVGATEPTIASRRFERDALRTSWVRVIDPIDPTRSYDSLQYSPSEQADLLRVADQVFTEVEAACDKGECQVYETVLV